MGLKITNNATAELAAGISDVATSLSVKAGQGTLFPSLSTGDYFYCTLQKSNGDLEIIKVTARASDDFTTIVRAQDGTTAKSFSADDIVSLRPVRAIILDLQAGTPEESFQLDSDNSGPRLKHNTAVIEFKNAADDAYVEGKVKQLSVSDAAPTQIYHLARKDYVDSIIPAGTKMYFYQDTAPAGWTIDGAVADTLLSVKGGSQAYNVSGGTIAGTWTQPNHTHAGPSHVHSGPSHAHTVSNHVHSGPNHYHSGPNHYHSGPSHVHQIMFNSGGTLYAYDQYGTANLTMNTQNAVGGSNFIFPPSYNAYSALAGTGSTGYAGTGSTGDAGTGNTGSGGAQTSSYAGTGDTGASGTGSTGGGASAATYRPYAANGIIATKN